MHLNRLGQAAMGFGTVSIDGVAVAALTGYGAGNYGGPCWLNDTTIVYQNNGLGSLGPSIVEAFDLTGGSSGGFYDVWAADTWEDAWADDTWGSGGSGARTTLSNQGANFIAAGGNRWAAWLLGPSGSLRTNLPGIGPYTTSALGDVSPDGEFVRINTSSNLTGLTGLTVYSAAGATLLALPEVTLAQTFIRLKSHLLLYRDSSGWVMRHVLGGAFRFRPRINETINWIVPVTTAAGKTFVLEVSDRITLRYADRADGWQLMPMGTITFNPDVIEYAAGVLRIGWSSTQGELPGDLVLMDFTVATGATSIGTVSGGTIVWTAGDPLERTTFDVGPLQGSSTGGSLYPPLKEPVIDSRGLMTRPWAIYEQTVRTGLAETTAAIAALPPNVPPAAGFGIVEGGTGGPVVATTASDTLTVTSLDGSLAITASPIGKALDLRVNAGAVPGLGRTAVFVVPGDDDDTLPLVIPGPPGASGSAGGGTSYVPVSTGEEPLVIVSNGAGSVLLTPFTP